MNMHLILVLAHMGSCSVNMGKELVGKIIHVESLEQGDLIKDVFFNSWSQLLVIDCRSGTVCLESIRFRRHYLKCVSR